MLFYVPQVLDVSVSRDERLMGTFCNGYVTSDAFCVSNYSIGGVRSDIVKNE